MQEVWKDMPGYEGIYQVSNLGRARSITRIVEVYKKGVQCDTRHNGVLLKQTPNSKGYMRVVVSKNNKQKRLLVHRLVAKLFVENPANNTIVNHRDFNSQNNNADNLEWTTRSGNMQHSAKAGRLSWTPETREAQERAIAKRRKPVVATNIVTGEKLRFSSISDCQAQGFAISRVSKCCNNIAKTHKGFVWAYENGE